MSSCIRTLLEQTACWSLEGTILRMCVHFRYEIFSFGVYPWINLQVYWSDKLESAIDWVKNYLHWKYSKMLRRYNRLAASVGLFWSVHFNVYNIILSSVHFTNWSLVLLKLQTNQEIVCFYTLGEKNTKQSFVALNKSDFFLPSSL